MFLGEIELDRQQLATDGQHWRAVYGGARLVLGCMRCSPSTFVVFRLFLLVLTVGAFCFEAWLHPMDVYWFLKFEHWTLLLMLIYFSFVSILTIGAACTRAPGIARTTPGLVRLTEIAYGALLPAAIVNFLVMFVVEYCYRAHCISAATTGTAGASAGGAYA